MSQEFNNKMVFDRLAFEIYRNVKCNQHALPRYYPGRVFAEVNLADIEFSIASGDIAQVWDNLVVLNNYILGKLGKMRYGNEYLKQNDLDRLKYFQFYAEKNTLVQRTGGNDDGNGYVSDTLVQNL